KPKPVTWMSLPHKPQLFILAICRLSEPLSNTCLLPYLYYLIRSLQPTDDTSPASISRQAGLLVSLFALSQFATSVPWASFANHFGRKPTIIIGIVLSIISNVGFGFSTTIPAVMFWRILAGLGNGNIGVMRTMTAEIVKEKKYQSRAFLLLPLIFNAGVVIGLFLGGCLAQPIINIPWLFGPEGAWNFAKDPEGVAWMREYPFALPTLFNAGVLMCSLFFAVFGLKETMPGKTDHKDWGLGIGDAGIRLFKRLFMKEKSSGYAVLNTDERNDSEIGLLETEPNTPKTPLPQISQPSTPRPRLSIFSKEIYTREVLYTFISFALLPLHNAAFMQIFPVFLSTPPSSTPSYSAIKFNGGLGLASPTIGIFLSAFGIFGILIQLLIYPSLQAWLGTLRSYRVALAIFPIAYIVAPYICLIPSSNFPAQAAAIACILFLQVTARTFGIPSTVILLTNSAPSPLALGAVHGVGNMLSSLARAVGPALGGVIFGWGVEDGAVGLVWWGYLTVISLVGLGWSWMLREGERPVEK
ncbi:MFS general substrate transporter, partial [Mollisia scopiformis]